MKVRALVDVFIGGYRAAGTEFNYDGEPDPNLAIVPETPPEQLQPMIRVGDTISPELMARLQAAIQAGAGPASAILPAQPPVNPAGFVPAQLAAVQAAAAAAQAPLSQGPPPAPPGAVMPSSMHPLAVPQVALPVLPQTISAVPSADPSGMTSLRLPTMPVDDGRDLVS